MYRWREALLELNTFPNIDRSLGIIATRIYFVLLSLSISVLIAYTLITGQFQTILIEKPTESIYHDLSSKHSTTFQCQCNQMAINYGSFLSISVSYHPICSSRYVHSEWIELLFNANTTLFFPLDFRALAHSYFQLIATLCSFARRSLQNAIDDFLLNTILTTDIVSPSSLTQRCEAEASFLRRSTANDVQRILRLIRNLTQTNRLQTASSTSTINILYYDTPNSVTAFSWTDIFRFSRSGCSCSSSSFCTFPMGFYPLIQYDIQQRGDWSNITSLNITGFRVGCYPIEGLLQSTIECFYRNECLTLIQQSFEMSQSQILSSFNSDETRFPPVTTTVETLINELFIETWTTLVSFSHYFQHCQPDVCSYTMIERNILYVITRILGIYGGLTTVLRFLIPLLVNWVHIRWTRNNETDRKSWNEHFETLKIKIMHLNLFDEDDQNPFSIMSNIITTRLYLFLFAFSTTILICYTALNTHRSTVFIFNPSEKLYETLIKQHSTSIDCLCRQITIPYGSFVSLTPTYHPICSSLFISNEWIILSQGKSFNVLHTNAIQSFFIALKAFCSLINQTLIDAWKTQAQAMLIGTRLLTKEDLHVRTETNLNEYKLNTGNEFNRIVTVVQSYLSTMFSILGSDVQFAPRQSVQNNTTIDFKLISTPKRNNCSCALSDDCLDVVTFNGITNLDSNVTYIVPTIYVGCSIVEAVFASTLECFYNRTCLDAVIQQNRDFSYANVSILNENITRYAPTMSIGNILQTLMIEEWNDRINFSLYYAECDPKQCSYDEILRNNALVIITTVVGLLGGLSVSLRLIIPVVVRWIRNRLYRIELVHQPAMSFSHYAFEFYRQVQIKISTLNLFDRRDNRNDFYHRRTEILSTRFYLFFLALTISILIIYTVLMGEMKTVTIASPSLVTYEDLVSHSIYSKTLNCPCKHLSIRYDSFLSITYEFHALCSNHLLSFDLLRSIYNPLNVFNYSFDNYHLFTLPHFRWLIKLCSLVNRTLINQLNMFYARSLITGRVQSRQIFLIQIDGIINQFYQSVPRIFLRTLDLIEEISHGNGLISQIQSNWYYTSLVPPIQYASIWTRSRQYTNGNSSCTCATNHQCTTETLENQCKIGCSPLQSLSQSSIQCLQNISFELTIQSLVDRLFVDQWMNRTDYDRYYQLCSPSFCTYSFNKQADAIYLITNIISLVGGLTVALKILVPCVVRLVRRYRHMRVITIE